MIYFYYGFFLFLLYKVAPLWMFFIGAAASWWGMRFSVRFQKIMKIPVSTFGKRDQHAVELEKRLKKGAPKSGRKRRRFQRFASSLDVSYQVLGDEWKKESRNHGFD